MSTEANAKYLEKLVEQMLAGKLTPPGLHAAQTPPVVEAVLARVHSVRKERDQQGIDHFIEEDYGWVNSRPQDQLTEGIQ